ncbi:MAG: contractile injection system tape measure protein [Cyanobacteriota bacterium]|nr:contractile injection system tape measure protein [Cyanobacteriota bacterium]
MNANCHRVHRLELEFRMTDRTLAETTMARMGQLHREHLHGVLARVCSELSPTGHPHRFEHVELDLGTFNAQDLEGELPLRLEAALRRFLAPKLPSPVAKDSASDDQGEAHGPRLSPHAALELLTTFANTGNLPWWAPRQRPTIISEALDRLLEGPSQDPNTLMPLLQVLANIPWANERLQNTVAAKQHPHLAAALERLSSFVRSGNLPVVAEPAFPADPLSSHLPAAMGRKSDADAGEPHAAAVNPQPLPPAVALPAPSRLPPPPTKTLANPGPEVAAPSDWIVDGAGLVLLWPFLETLCRRLELLDANRQFRGESERQRAVVLFGLLVGAEAEPEPLEWRLTLAKLLAGLHPDQPWMQSTRILPVEQEELQAVLTATLSHANGRLGDDPQDLQRRWLSRPGLLTHRPSGWLLQLERQEDDGVIAELPWSLQWLRLPWMADGLQVSW